MSGVAYGKCGNAWAWWEDAARLEVTTIIDSALLSVFAKLGGWPWPDHGDASSPTLRKHTRPCRVIYSEAHHTYLPGLQSVGYHPEDQFLDRAQGLECLE